jgi:type I restriction enzyme S subunit
MEVRPGYKLTDLGVIPNDWEVERLGSLAYFVTSGSRGWAQFYSESGAFFIRSQNVRDGRLSFEDQQYVTPPRGAEGNRTKVKLNDLLITITGNSVGNVALVEQIFDEAYISQHVGLVRLREPTHGPYICRYLSPYSPGNPQIAGSQSGQSKPGLNLHNLRDFWVAHPPTSNELYAIAGTLSDVDGLLGGLDRLIAKKRYLKQAAMQQLLTGQIRLPGFHGEWEVKRLGDVLKVRHGKSQHGITAPDGKYPILASGGEIGRTNTFIYDKPSVLIGRKGTIDSPQYVDSRFWTVDTLFFTEIGGEADAKFIFYKFTMIRWRSYNEASGVPSLNAKTIENISVTIPPIHEQSAIAEVLTEMNAELAALEKRLEKTRALKQAMMQELLTGKIRLV